MNNEFIIKQIPISKLTEVCDSITPEFLHEIALQVHHGFKETPKGFVINSNLTIQAGQFEERIRNFNVFLQVSRQYCNLLHLTKN